MRSAMMSLRWPARHQTRPARPAARLQLMSISDFNFAGSGLTCMSTVCFITNTPILAMFWRISIGCGLSLVSTALMKIDHRRRLKSNALCTFLSGPAQVGWTSCSCRAAFSSACASISRGEAVVCDVRAYAWAALDIHDLDGGAVRRDRQDYVTA